MNARFVYSFEFQFNIEKNLDRRSEKKELETRTNTF